MESRSERCGENGEEDQACMRDNLQPSFLGQWVDVGLVNVVGYDGRMRDDLST